MVKRSIHRLYRQHSYKSQFPPVYADILDTDRPMLDRYLTHTYSKHTPRTKTPCPKMTFQTMHAYTTGILDQILPSAE
jgi:hypothetical protein